MTVQISASQGGADLGVRAPPREQDPTRPRAENRRPDQKVQAADLSQPVVGQDHIELRGIQGRQGRSRIGGAGDDELAGEGFLEPHQEIGLVVDDEDARRWRGHRANIA